MTEQELRYYLKGITEGLDGDETEARMKLYYSMGFLMGVELAEGAREAEKAN